MDILKKIKEMLENKNRKKLVENAVFVIIIGIIIIIAGGVFFSKSEKTNNDGSPQQSTGAVEALKTLTSTEKDATEERLKAILSQIQGVGKVDVMITYTVSKENIPAYDVKKSDSNTDEKDSGGGTRNISQNDSDSTVVYEDNQSGGKRPVIVKEVQPVVKGVLVVAEGAASPQVMEKICKSVQILMDIPIHKVQVVEMKK